MAEDPTDTVRSILASLTGLAPEEIVSGLSLLEEGLLTSLQVVELVARLEAETGARFLDQDLTPENFAGLEAIVALVRARRPGA